MRPPIRPASVSHHGRVAIAASIGSKGQGQATPSSLRICVKSRYAEPKKDWHNWVFPQWPSLAMAMEAAEIALSRLGRLAGGP
jgi:hypothetical protein